MPPENESFGDASPRIRRGRVDSLTLYEITESELDTLEQGSPASLHLNFAIFFVSTALSFLVALLTTTISSDRTYCFFVVVMVVSFTASVVLGVLWFRQRKSASLLTQKIRQRVQPDRVNENLNEEST
jgi:hypothetical protein